MPIRCSCIDDSFGPSRRAKPVKLSGACLLAGTILCAGGICSPNYAWARDKTPPVIKATVQGTQGNNGWYTSDVSVIWSVTDTGSKISSTTGCGTVSVNADTTGKTFTCKAKSGGGKSSKSVNIKRDTTPPKAILSAPSSGANYAQKQIVTANYSCTDATSGVASCAGTVANKTNIDTSSAGTKFFSVISTDRAGNTTNSSISYIVTGATVAAVKGTHLFAWNDLGMHCMDSDYSVFTLLPPFNDLIAQLVVNGKLVTSGYKLKYQATPDPSGSINSYSLTKSNFWDYDQPLFGDNLAANVGLTGNPTPSTTPALMTWDTTYSWFEASGLPITPIDDKMNTNYFPMVKVTATDSSGKTVASSNAVLPVSSEINCKTCHASGTGSSAAKPVAGWIGMAAFPEKDWRLNVLRLHDQKNAGAAYTSLLAQKGFGETLESTVVNNGKPILCDTCHTSNALAIWGINGTVGVSDMTVAMHKRHANVLAPGSAQVLNSIATRSSCYNCHPGEKTQCLRGAMGNAVNSSNKHTMECQSCHGSMLTVANASRDGWFDMPTCQSCHHDGKRETVAINTDGTFKAWADTRFASNPDTPALGVSLFRFSTGHGKLQCEACHNSTHAEYTNLPSANGNQVNDNLQAINAQGYAAAIRECTVCHATMPNSINGGPHGMHQIGQSWVSKHEGALDSVTKNSCYYCHGTTSSGSPLAVMKTTKTLTIEGATKVFAANERVTCWSCHNGPNP